MMKFKLKSRNFEKLQRFSAFLQILRKSEQISLKSAKLATKFEKCKSFCISNLENAKILDEIL